MSHLRAHIMILPGSTVRFARMPDWLATFHAEETRRVFEFCLGRTYRVVDVDADRRLFVLDVSADIDRRFGGEMNDIRLEEEYLEEVERAQRADGAPQEAWPRRCARLQCTRSCSPCVINMRKAALMFGLGFIAFGLLFGALPVLRGGEKPDAIFILGHWFDVVWELALPCLSLGVLVCASAALTDPSTSRRGISP